MVKMPNYPSNSPRKPGFYSENGLSDKGLQNVISRPAYARQSSHESPINRKIVTPINLGPINSGPGNSLNLNSGLSQPSLTNIYPSPDSQQPQYFMVNRRHFTEE